MHNKNKDTNILEVFYLYLIYTNTEKTVIQFPLK